ncbi:Hsp20/alpha crystallin family protein [Patescibacteria group bacterium]|nr:Hsp20/alpha crystallin family protein [Patescibacteria group bacterium]
MMKEKQSFFEKISGGKKTFLKVEDADENNSSLMAAEESKEVLEGQLAVDVYETNSSIVVESIIGGVNPDNINVSVSNNVLTIKGIREKSIDAAENINYFVSECFWGPFSRSIILPCEVDVDSIKAGIKKGVLKITLPKLVGSKTRKIIIEEV